MAVVGLFMLLLTGSSIADITQDEFDARKGQLEHDNPEHVPDAIVIATWLNKGENFVEDENNVLEEDDFLWEKLEVGLKPAWNELAAS